MQSFLTHRRHIKVLLIPCLICIILTEKDIYGNMKKTQKSKSYKVHGNTNLIGIQDKKQYAKQKKIMQQGFSDSANREHEPKVIREIDTFIEKISENEIPSKDNDGWSNPKNMTLWCEFCRNTFRTSSSWKV